MKSHMGKSVSAKLKVKAAAMATGVALALSAMAAQANITFSFVETAGTVKMFSSGVLDTSKLVSVAGFDGWGGVGTENNGPGDIDIMGGNLSGIDTAFAFHAGTNASAITNPNGPFAFSSFPAITTTGNKSFATYSGFDSNNFRIPGIMMSSASMEGVFWAPDQTWTYEPGQTFGSLGLNVGIYSVVDSVTQETITIQIGSPVPEPETYAMMLAGLGLLGFAARRRKLKAAQA